MVAISVVVPTYNGAAFIEETLRSILTQTRSPQEVIVVDDASTDSTPEAVASIARTANLPVRLIRLHQNSGGPAHPVNLGVAGAASPYVALCEQDDRMRANKLEMLSACVEAAPATALVISRYFVMHNGMLRRPIAVQDDSFSQFATLPKKHLVGPYYLLDREAAYHAAINRCFAVSLSNMLVNKEIWMRLGGLDERLCAIADHDFLLRLGRNYSIGWVDERLWEFHRHRHSLLQTTQRDRFAEDYGRIWLREVRRAQRPETKILLRALLRQSRLECAYHNRQTGQYGQALAWFGRAICETGLCRDAAFGIMKLLPHFFYYRVLMRKKG